MSSNCIFFGWNRSLPGRERMSAEHFQAFGEYLAAQQRNGAIQSFEAVFLDPHGGDLNGFFLIKGESAKLDQLIASDEWVTHQIRAMVHLDRGGGVRGASGELIAQRMAAWLKEIPAK
ncbi:hypothetical protein [Piscinibacter sp. XHJ-5]|uniref:hypothetical protein n=1 Tax=Piscinibacter sp. XHJ-5 TaxID=3037797 RepID=UPI002452ADBC|nr:hypothetical protein [Piscinibacter sp. XHJ-5]